MVDNKILRTVECIETFKAGYTSLKEEEFNQEDLTDFIDLFPEYALKISSIFHFLNGDLSISIDDEETAEEIEEDEDGAEEKVPYSRKGMSYNRMTKLDAENISKYIAEKCRGRADFGAIVNDIYEYINGKFGKSTIRDLVHGRTWSTISQAYFKIEKGKIKAV
jgi:hypothetical protein